MINIRPFGAYENVIGRADVYLRPRENRWDIGV
jgi:hypothetical protein